jgi:hypothetical protein
MVRGRGVGCSGRQPGHGCRAAPVRRCPAAAGRRARWRCGCALVHDACVLHAGLLHQRVGQRAQSGRADVDAVARPRERPAGPAAQHQHVAFVQRHEFIHVGQQLRGRAHELREINGLLQLAVDAHLQLEMPVGRRPGRTSARNAQKAVQALELDRRAEKARVRHSGRSSAHSPPPVPAAPITMAMVAPTSTCGTCAGTGMVAPCALQVLAGLTYSTGALGGAL